MIPLDWVQIERFLVEAGWRRKKIVHADYDNNSKFRK